MSLKLNLPELLETDRLRIVPVSPDRLQQIQEVVANNQDDIHRSLWGMVNTPKRVENRVREFATQNYLDEARHWLLLENNSDAIVGACDIYGLEPSPDGKRGYASCWIDINHRGKGYATEALPVIFKDAQKNLGVTEIIGAIHPSNTDSIALAKRLGLSEPLPQEGKVARLISKIELTAAAPTNTSTDIL